jgi:hypothetical protein
LNPKIQTNVFVCVTKILMKKEMCTDFKIIAANHHDGEGADFSARLWASGECE